MGTRGKDIDFAGEILIKLCKERFDKKGRNKMNSTPLPIPACRGDQIHIRMPDWFIDNLSVEEKRAFIERLRTKPINFRQLSWEDLRNKKYYVKKSISNER